MDPNIGKKVRVWEIGRRTYERVLHEDFQGLYVKYNDKKIRVKQELNSLDEPIDKSYIAR